MATQPGILALGTPEHCHLELDLEPGRSAEDLVRGVAGLPHPRRGGRSAVGAEAPRRPERRDPDPGGGDPVCWLDQVCPACGRLSERSPSGLCAACGEPWERD